MKTLQSTIQEHKKIAILNKKIISQLHDILLYHEPIMGEVLIAHVQNS